MDDKEYLANLHNLIIELADQLIRTSEEFMKIKFGTISPETTDEIINVLFNGAFDFLGICLTKIADCLDDKGVQRLSLNSISALNNHLHDIKRKEMLN